MEDELMVVLPENHKLADKEYFPIKGSTIVLNT